MNIDPDLQPLVLDIGSGFTKCGYSGDDGPRESFYTIVDRPRNPGIMVGMTRKDDFWDSDRWQAKRGVLKKKYPVQNGIITNFNDIEKIFHHTFYNILRVTPEEHPILLMESPYLPKSSGEKLLSIMFETFNVPAYYSMTQAVSSLFQSGITSGIVLESGHGVTHSVGIYDGFILRKTLQKQNYGGKDVSDKLKDILNERGYVFESEEELEYIRLMKEKMCFVSNNPKTDLLVVESQDYRLPDGHILPLASSRFLAPEILFSKNLDDLEGEYLKISLHSRNDQTFSEHISKIRTKITFLRKYNLIRRKYNVSRNKRKN